MTGKHFFIGIDIGGTNIKIALVNDKGRLSHINRIWINEIQPTLEDFLHHVLGKVDSIFQTCDHEINGIGLTIPGLLRPDGCGVLFSINLSILNGYNLVKFFTDHFHVPVKLINDLVAHSLAESQFGSGKGVGRLLCVSLGTGVGHTFLDHGKPLIMVNGISGDSGRMILDSQSTESDMSGIFGSVEALCGVKAIELLVKKFHAEDRFPTARDVITVAREEDLIAREILKIISRRLAQYLVNLASIYFPEVISITGGQTEAGDFFIDECRTEFFRLSASYFENYFRLIGKEQNIKIVKAQAGGLAGILGSVIPLL